MMTNKDAIRILNPDGDNVWRGICCEETVEDVAEACRVAVAALKKQIKVNPGPLPGVTHRRGTCPRCLSTEDESANYCRVCGQALDWSTLTQR